MTPPISDKAVEAAAKWIYEFRNPSSNWEGLDHPGVRANFEGKARRLLTAILPLLCGGLEEELKQVEKERDEWKGRTEPDISPGDVIAAEPDGIITLDDGITTWNPERACCFLTAEATEKAGQELVRVRAAAKLTADESYRLMGAYERSQARLNQVREEVEQRIAQCIKDGGAEGAVEGAVHGHSPTAAAERYAYEDCLAILGSVSSCERCGGQGLPGGDTCPECFRMGGEDSSSSASGGGGSSGVEAAMRRRIYELRENERKAADTTDSKSDARRHYNRVALLDDVLDWPVLTHPPAATTNSGDVKERGEGEDSRRAVLRQRIADLLGDHRQWSSADIRNSIGAPTKAEVNELAGEVGATKKGTVGDGEHLWRIDPGPPALTQQSCSTTSNSLSREPGDRADAFALSKYGEEIDAFDGAYLKDWAELLLAMEADGWRFVQETETGRDQCSPENQPDSSGLGSESSSSSSSHSGPRTGSSSLSSSASSSPRSSGDTHLSGDGERLQFIAEAIETAVKDRHLASTSWLGDAVYLRDLATRLSSEDSSRVEGAVALLEREAQDASMWVERHWRVEQYLGATSRGDLPWIGDLVKPFRAAAEARDAQENRGMSLRHAAALLAKSPTATQPDSTTRLSEDGQIGLRQAFEREKVDLAEETARHLATNLKPQDEEER